VKVHVSVLVALMLVIPSAVMADRLITTPQGRKVPEGVVKFELLSTPSRDVAFGWIGYGLTQNFEIEISGESFDSDKITPGLNMSYNYLSPITDIAPGISFGVLDVTNQTRGEIAAYAAISYYFGNWGDLNQNVPTILTVGGWSRDGGGVFYSVSLPFSQEFRLIGEADRNSVTAGVEIVPFQGASLKYLFREGDPTVGFSFQRRF
jgi:hypothetical protein